MITALYANILAILIIWLAVQVIKQRRLNQIAYADGGVEALQIARSAQSNATEYIPITLILMALLEFNSAYPTWIHLTGIIFIIGRVIHAKGILKKDLKKRIRGMQVTFLVILSLVVLNMIYLPYDKLW
ncbi:MAPEG family protein [Vibrio alginolyticus]|uniref:MAPEG family protein n=1 Tax=Vibrio TaxID=662 RepID=UPI0015597EAD|nr:MULTISPECIES: MAPEG family protein [Vibrio]EIE5863807.1 MAPEG family protein [Vibrio alginolyticus]EKA5862051.1 MAPEG family protein [Vibrio alginolyticus]ELA6637714.1 MAPEG family protein [Vibrio alginolyticus]ELK9266657.1 MAPEG family protein [Vibrio alginolyticus]ELN6906406.1 MAPEG family protein [Vibrio alginolyticus]